MMRVTEVEAVADLPFRELFVVRSVPSKRHVFVRIGADDRRDGRVEGVPVSLLCAGYRRRRALDGPGPFLAHALLGHDPRDIRVIAGGWAEIDGLHSAKAAVETALWDLLG